MRVRRVLALAAAVAGLLPAAASGQSAGDDQYEDPFAGEQEEQAATPTPAPAAPAAQAPEPASTAAPPAPAATAAPAGELPRTGADAALIGAAGLSLILAGVAARARLRDDGA